MQRCSPRPSIDAGEHDTTARRAARATTPAKTSSRRARVSFLESFRVSSAAKSASVQVGVVEGDGRRHQRARQTATPGFVGAGHHAASAAPQVVRQARVHGGTRGAGARQGKPMRVTGQ